MKTKSAKGIRGHLLDTFDGNYVFRVYDENYNYKDYLLRHCDLTVIIDDVDADLYEYPDGACFLDHAAGTLGE
jgi:hypothetical protein